MGKYIDPCIIIVATGVWLSISVAAPWVLDDSNTFLAGFVNHEFLNVLGVVFAITLASAANIHLQFNQIEDIAKRPALQAARSSVRRSAYWLIATFGLAVVTVVAKPLAADTPIGEALFNGFSLIILLSNILILIDLTRLVFTIPPMYRLFGDDDESED